MVSFRYNIIIPYLHLKIQNYYNFNPNHLQIMNKIKIQKFYDMVRVNAIFNY